MRIHFISIGGSVMHQLAIALHKKGYIITGSDDEIFEPSRSNLAGFGLLPSTIGWNENNITSDLDAVLLGMHARADNPELIKAKAMNLPVYSFPEYIYKESLQKKRIVVGGSHGKTTTTSMIMHVLKEAGLSFDYLVGAKLPGFNQSVDITHAPIIVCEGDEYPASAVERRPKFHFLYPHIAVLTGIAWDHINVFPTFENYLEQFEIFLDKIEPGGTLIFNETDDVLSNLVKSYPKDHFEKTGYGIPDHTQEGDTTILKIGAEQVPLNIFGNHNLLNAHAAWHVCRKLGIGEGTFLKAISSFSGAAKRLEVLAETPERVVFRDFAHAPSKVKATMEAVKKQYPSRRVAAVLELHTYSSLNEKFMPHYKGALEAADNACVFYSPHAMEVKRMPPLSAGAIVDGFQKKGLTVLTDSSDLEMWIERNRPEHDNLLLMSSGTFDGLDALKVAQNWIK
ncbi:MAG: Mur ligase family protein [Chitinophagaceae bacterium]|nr:Mur ligase family protein [Chitinophagaceae bacterium]